MNNKFDELAKGLAQSVTRRQALRSLGAGLAGMSLAFFGLASKADGGGGAYVCCLYECYNSIMGGKLIRSKFCGGACPAPSSFCRLASSRSVADCKTCNT
jgi:hypothetical protein